MPLAFLTSVSGSTSLGGFASSQPIPFSWLDNVHLPPSNLAYIGLRDIDRGEKAIIREHNIAAFSMHEVDRYGIGKVVEMALDQINPDRSKPIHLSFDVDALDPSVAPSTGTPVRGGLTFREGHYICERLYETGLLVAVDLMVCEYRHCWHRLVTPFVTGGEPFLEGRSGRSANCCCGMLSSPRCAWYAKSSKQSSILIAYPTCLCRRDATLNEPCQSSIAGATHCMVVLLRRRGI